MKKRIKRSMAGALFGAAACPVMAQTTVAVSGVIDTGLSYVNHVGDGTQSKLSAVNSILGVSNIGFRGKEDLGNGLNAIFNLQAGFNPTNGSQSATGQLFSRNAYVGLDGGFGALTVGKQWNFNDDWLVGNVFLGGYNSGAVFKFSEFDAVSEIYNNIIKYVTPTVKGLKAGLMYSAGEVADNTSAGSVYNAAVQYTQGPFYFALTYDNEKDGAATNNTGNTYKLITLGGSYTFGLARVRLGYANSHIGGPGTFQSISSLGARKANAVELGLDYIVTPVFTASADVLYRKNTTLSNNSKVYRLLGVYSLSKRTSLIANLAYLNNADGASETLVNADSGAVGGGFANQNQTEVTLGIRHTF
ncbi:Outer membrane protein (porin) [Collimonas sp. OK607]|nr:Outer membrane protein (porin) [Collimonas sp. OK607]